VGVKAVVYDRYGDPDVLRVEDVPVPTPDSGQVRVEVAATSVNLSDWEGLRGSPGYARMGGLHTHHWTLACASGPQRRHGEQYRRG
jgi:NADPH:quinone reductase-like Zn-dependent oxidoreductase